ncbi:SPW repeat family protein [Collimonas arenae]|nr:SPW repeat family protein [Collimonas arenae]
MDYWLDSAAASNACAIGVALVIFNLISARRIVDSGQEIVNILIGLWLILSPFALNFGAEKYVTLNALILGSAVVILAIWQIRDAVK